jgi:enoyl-[acyl-carrier protein] reductase III
MIDLSGKVALVTGSSRGIGRACAIRLAEVGATLVVDYITAKSAANEVGKRIRAMSRNVAVVKADVSEREDVEEMMQFIRKTYGRLDIIISNAATGGFRPLLSTTDRDFEAAMNTNVRALLYLVQSAIEMLADHTDRAKIVAISSHGSQLALPMYGTIGASKAALEAIIRHLALELGARNINFNVIKAGLVETDSTRLLPGAQNMFNESRKKSLVGDRLLTADDVANAVLFLCSPLSDMIQGEIVTVDGGASVNVQ